MSGEDDGARLPSRTTSFRRWPSPTSGLFVMARHARRFPGRSQILEADLDAFDIEADGAASREGELDRAFGRHVAGGEGDGEERQHGGRRALADPVGLDRADA